MNIQIINIMAFKDSYNYVMNIVFSKLGETQVKQNQSHKKN